LLVVCAFILALGIVLRYTGIRAHPQTEKPQSEEAYDDI